MPRPLIRYLRPYRRQLGWGMVLLLITNVLDKAIPWLLKEAVDSLEGGELESVKDYALGVVGLATVLWIVRTRSRIQIFNVGRDVEYDLRDELIKQVHRLGPRFFRRVPTGEVMSRATSDLGQVRLFVGFGALNVTNTIFAFVGAITLMIIISPELTLFALAPYLLVIPLTRFFGAALYDRSREAQEALGQMADAAQENIAGVRIIRAFALEEREKARFDEVNENAVTKNMRLVVLRGLMWPVLMGVGSLGILAVLWKGSEMMLRGELSTGQFAAFFAYVGQLLWPTLAFGYVLSVVQRGRASYARVREILDAPPEVETSSTPTPLLGTGKLDIRGLSFSYGETEVLKIFHYPYRVSKPWPFSARSDRAKARWRRFFHGSLRLRRARYLWMMWILRIRNLKNSGVK